MTRCLNSPRLDKLEFEAIPSVSFNFHWLVSLNVTLSSLKARKVYVAVCQLGSYG
jgi:hypothetical protein